MADPGHIDSAIVCGTHMLFEPFVLQLQQESGMCSARGVSAVLDEGADGLVKGESVSGVFLQRRRDARRVYATVRTARMNNDAKKTIGMFFPSAEAQEELMIETYTDAGIDPLELTYFEAHCTGTKVWHYRNK
jgi:fatty acid synthase